MQLHGTSFEFDEWDVLAGTNALKVRAEIYCTKHRLHSSTVDCVSNLTDLAEFTINVNNEGFDKLLVRDQIFTYSKRLHVDTNKLFERALSFCDYFKQKDPFRKRFFHMVSSRIIISVKRPRLSYVLRVIMQFVQRAGFERIKVSWNIFFLKSYSKCML